MASPNSNSVPSRCFSDTANPLRHRDRHLGRTPLAVSPDGEANRRTGRETRSEEASEICEHLRKYENATKEHVIYTLQTTRGSDRGLSLPTPQTHGKFQDVPPEFRDGIRQNHY